MRIELHVKRECRAARPLRLEGMLGARRESDRAGLAVLHPVVIPRITLELV